MSTDSTAGNVKAILGPTNTGKTHLAIERMLAHSTGMIGLPLRLLAREVYDRVVAQKGVSSAALITGEERIVPKNARYFIATVEAMPLDLDPAFVAVDEIQLAEDKERGHVFTNRLLYARGREETMFLGAATMAPLIRTLLPDAEIITRPRFSNLTYAGHKKLTRLPRRSAVVGFSADQVYAMAELIRRQRGGAAVVLGALSPRTRNAQVELYQSGDVDFLVATDAIGMGLNLDVKHVAFAGLEKFDGVTYRALQPVELAQIAGRAGRYQADGTFGCTANAPDLDTDTAKAIEAHTFAPVTRIQWRSAALDFSAIGGLIRSLEQPPAHPALTRVRDLTDVRALKAMAGDADIRGKLHSPARLKLIWDVCQVPDFRQTLEDNHHRLLTTLFEHLTEGQERLSDDWVNSQIRPVNNVTGDIDALSNRIAHIRTWTFISHRAHWFHDAAHWQDVTRAIEDRLSDALHERLTQRFVDRRTGVLMRKLKEKDRLMSAVSPDGDVTVEEVFVGRLSGLKFEPDTAEDGVHKRTLNEAARGPVADELAQRGRRLIALFDAAQKADALIAGSEPQKAQNQSHFKAKKEPPAPVSLSDDGTVIWDGAVVARLTPGRDVLHPELDLEADELLDAGLRTEIEARLKGWLDAHVRTVFAPLFALEGEEIGSGLARGLAFQLMEGLGVLPRDGEVAETVRALDQDARGALRKLGVRFGEITIYQPALLKPKPAQLKLLLATLYHGWTDLPEPPGAGLCSIPAEKRIPPGFYEVCGFRQTGRRAVRIDMLERLCDMLRPLNAEGPFEVTSDHMSIVGCSGDDFVSIMLALGYRSQTKPKPAEDTPTDGAPGEDTGTADAGTEDAGAEDAGTEETASEDAQAAAGSDDPAPEADAPTGAEPDQTPAPEAPEVSQAQAGPAAENQPEDAAAPGDADQSPDEPETITLWRLKRGARQIGGQKPKPHPRDRAPGPKKQKQAKPHKGGPKKGGKPAPRDKPIDPDSPFAKLAALKDKLG